jgi:hypothetical protein
MPSYTTHYQFIKPGEDEFYSIGVFNANADTADAALKSVAEGAAAAQAGAEPARAVPTQAQAQALNDTTVYAWTPQRIADTARAAAVPAPGGPGYVPDTPWILLQQDANFTVWYRGQGGFVYVQFLSRAPNTNSAPLPEGFRPLGTVRLLAGMNSTVNVNHASLLENGFISTGSGAAHNIVCFTYSTLPMGSS